MLQIPIKRYNALHWFIFLYWCCSSLNVLVITSKTSPTAIATVSAFIGVQQQPSSSFTSRYDSPIITKSSSLLSYSFNPKRLIHDRHIKSGGTPLQQQLSLRQPQPHHILQRTRISSSSTSLLSSSPLSPSSSSSSLLTSIRNSFHRKWNHITNKVLPRQQQHQNPNQLSIRKQMKIPNVMSSLVLQQQQQQKRPKSSLLVFNCVLYFILFFGTLFSSPQSAIAVAMGSGGSSSTTASAIPLERYVFKMCHFCLY
jgi:hypothetical protein